MNREKIIMVIALVGWGLFVGVNVTKTIFKDTFGAKCPEIQSK